MKKAFKIIVITVLLIVLIINVSIIIQTKTKPNLVPNILGFKPFIVLSGSMESKINVGDLVFVKEVNPSKLQVGDIIAFRDSENIVTTHRIVDKENQTRIAKLGNVVLFIQQPVGFVIMLMAISIICLLVYSCQNKKVNKEEKFKNEEERQAFEEFMKMRAEKNQK